MSSPSARPAALAYSSTLLALLVAGPLVAADSAAPAAPAKPAAHGDYVSTGTEYNDFRIRLGSFPGLKASSYDRNSVAVGTDEWGDKFGMDLELTFTHRFDSRSAHGGFLEFGLFFRDSAGKLTDQALQEVEADVASWGFLGGGGYSFRPNRTYSLELGPRLGIGKAEATEEVKGVYKRESHGGPYASAEAVLSNNLTIDTVQLSLAVGVACWYTTMNYDKDGAVPQLDGVWASYRGNGAFVTLGLGGRF